MKTAPYKHPSHIIGADNTSYTKDFLRTVERSASYPEHAIRPIVSTLLALLPFASFISQYALSVRAGTQQIFLHHPTIMVADWIFVPFNFFVVRAIDWRRGGRLFLIAGLSVMLNVLVHAFWQYNGLDAGHMITKTGIILPAGWVHLAFSIIETMLLVAFVFCRRVDALGLKVITILAAAYLLTDGIFGYTIHHGFIISDVVVLVSGIFFVLVYPRLVRRKQASR